MIYVSGFMWAYVLGQVCSLVANMDVYDQRFRQNMDHLNHMMEDRGLPKRMRRRIRDFFVQTKDAQRIAGHESLMKMMSPSIMGEVAVAVNEVWISKIHFLQRLMPEHPPEGGSDAGPP